MRTCRVQILFFAPFLGLFVLAAGPAPAHAQEFVQPVGPNVYEGHDGCRFHSHEAVFPRTYSYLYSTWFNQPRHVRYVGPDGRAYWSRTVRGLPMGTPWPSY
jgi:hypothetical protein